MTAHVPYRILTNSSTKMPGEREKGTLGAAPTQETWSLGPTERAGAATRAVKQRLSQGAHDGVKAEAPDHDVTDERLVVTDKGWAGMFTWRQGS